MAQPRFVRLSLIAAGKDRTIAAVIFSRPVGMPQKSGYPQKHVPEAIRCCLKSNRWIPPRFKLFFSTRFMDPAEERNRQVVLACLTNNLFNHISCGCFKKIIKCSWRVLAENKINVLAGRYSSEQPPVGRFYQRRISVPTSRANRFLLGRPSMKLFRFCCSQLSKHSIP